MVLIYYEMNISVRYENYEVCYQMNKMVLICYIGAYMHIVAKWWISAYMKICYIDAYMHTVTKWTNFMNNGPKLSQNQMNNGAYMHTVTFLQNW